MTTGLNDGQIDTALPAGPVKSVSFYRTQESGDQPQFHLLVCDLAQGQLMRATLGREEAHRLAETIKAAVGP